MLTCWAELSGVTGVLRLEEGKGFQPLSQVESAWFLPPSPKAKGQEVLWQTVGAGAAFIYFFPSEPWGERSHLKQQK